MLFNRSVPDQDALDDLAAEIEEAKRVHDYAQAKKLSRRLAKLEKRANRGRPQVRSVERRDSTRRIVPFEALSEGGIMRLDARHYQCALEIDDVNYLAARAGEQDDVRIIWGDYLNSLDHTVQCHIYLDNNKIDDDEFLSSLKMAPVAGDPDGNVLRAEFDAYCRDKLQGASRAMRRTRTAVITVEAETREKAAPMLARESERLIRIMRDLESDARMLDGQRWLDLIAAHTHPDDAAGVIDLRELATQPGTDARDLAAPSSLVRIGERADDSRMLVAGRRWTQSYVMTLEGYGNTMRDTFITDLSRLPYDITIAWHIRPWSTSEAESAAERHLREITEENENYKMSRSRPERGFFIDDDNLPASMRDAASEAKAYRDDLVRHNQRNFSVVTVITAAGRDEDELDEACRQIESVFSAHRKPRPDSWGNLREQMYTATLPIGACEVPYARTLTTDPLSHMVMWASAELMDDGGMIMGINPTTSAFETYDPVRYEHTNSFTFGQPGSGKSMTAKLTRIIQTHLRHPDDDVIIIDPENEYTAATQMLGGQVIDIHEASADHINPLDITASYDSENPGALSNPVPAKINFLQALVHMMASSISDVQKNLLDQAGRYVYAAWQADQRPENIPTLRDVYDYLNSIEGEAAQDAHHLATLMERYVVGTLNAFSHHTNVDINNHLVDLVFSKISSELRPIAMLCILDHIWVRVTANRSCGRRTWLIIDEFQLLLNDDYAVEQIDRYFTRGRKWNLYNLAITQNLSRMLDGAKTRYMLQNCPYVTIMNQTAEAAREAAEMFGLSETQERLIHSAGPGQGIYVLKNAVIPFDLTIDKRVCPELYSIATTRPADVKRILAAKSRPSAPAPAVEEPDRAAQETQQGSWRTGFSAVGDGRPAAPSSPAVPAEAVEQGGQGKDEYVPAHRAPEPPSREPSWRAGFASIENDAAERRTTPAGAGTEPDDPYTPAAEKASGHVAASPAVRKSWIDDSPASDLDEPEQAASAPRSACQPAPETEEERNGVEPVSRGRMRAETAQARADGHDADTAPSAEDRAAEAAPADSEGRPAEAASDPEEKTSRVEDSHRGTAEPAERERPSEPARTEQEAPAAAERASKEDLPAVPEPSGGDAGTTAESGAAAAPADQTATVLEGLMQRLMDQQAEAAMRQSDMIREQMETSELRKSEIMRRIDSLAENDLEIIGRIDDQDARIEQLEAGGSPAPQGDTDTVTQMPSEADESTDNGRAERESEGEPAPASGSRAFDMQRKMLVAMKTARINGTPDIDAWADITANDRGAGPASGMIEPTRRRQSTDSIFTDGGRRDG